ncbi:MAG: Gfo/Idh/MocA family protein [Saprospiraceae bacterium]
MKNWTRRSWLKLLGFVSLGSAIEDVEANDRFTFDISPKTKDAGEKTKPSKPVTCIILGAGARGNTYAAYSENYLGEMQVVGVAEPIPLRRNRFSKRYQVPDEQQFITWEDVFKVPKFADAVLICTPDHLHYGPAMEALQMGYDLLLEKPIAQSWEECKNILDQSKKYKRIVAVCHVLRYSPYFRKMKSVVDSKLLGKIISIQHMEPIEHIHMSHSYVRGIWRKKAETNPIIMAKSCHDMDILRWMTGRSCKDMVSFGSLDWFRAKNAPAGSTLRCTDGCTVEATCPYSALKIYYRDRTWLYHFDLPETADQGPAILEELKERNYGRCVYHCDNDVVDHQVCAMTFEDNITATFSMEAHTSYQGRRTRIMGSEGDLVGNEDEMTITRFADMKSEIWKTSDHSAINSGHGGGDFGLVRDFLLAVSRQDASILTSTLELSMESHLMAFKAEQSREDGRIVTVNFE